VAVNLLFWILSSWFCLLSTLQHVSFLFKIAVVILSDFGLRLINCIGGVAYIGTLCTNKARIVQFLHNVDDKIARTSIAKVYY